ncbi:MAG: DMT family transporter [Hyphomicrobiaceae bacterium]
MLRYAAVMVLAGIGVPIMASLNAQLGARIGSPGVAAIVLFVVGLIAATILVLATTGLAPLARVPGQPPYLLLGDLLVVFYVFTVTSIAPRFGIGNAIFCVLIGQLMSAAAIDHFGLIGAPARPLDAIRIAGLVLMAIGVFLTQRHR